MKLCKKCQKNKPEKYAHYCPECKEQKKADKNAYRESVRDRYWSADAVARNMRIMRRDHSTCQRCKIWNPNEILVVLHIIPVHKGGTDDDDNLITLCKHCHYAIHHKKGARLEVLFSSEKDHLLSRANKAIYGQTERQFETVVLPGLVLIDGVFYSSALEVEGE